MNISSRPCRVTPVLLFLALVALAPGRATARGSRYIDITTSGYAGSVPLTNFPVLVRLSTAITGFNYTMCRPDGADLVFEDADENVLPHEIDTWNTNGTSLVWVCVPELTATTALRLFISEPGASPPGYSTDGSTWAPADYAGVWHFASLSSGVTPDSSASHLDSTANKPAVSTGRVDGIVGNCVLNSAGSGNDGSGWLTTNYNGLAVGNTFTISGWCRHLNAMPLYERVFSRKTTYTGTGFEAELSSGQNNKMSVRGETGTSITVTTPNVMLGNWYHLAFVYTNNILRSYVNGAPGASGSIIAVTDNGQGLAFGNNSAKNEGTYKGSFDEFRLLDAVASADWVRAEYDTVANPAFNAYSAVASLGNSLQIVGLPYNYGVADPAYGLQEGRVNGQAYTCSVSRVWTNATEDLRAACTGWKRYGIDPDTFAETLLGAGSSNVMTYTHTDMERLEWHFARQFQILFAAGTGGTVTTNGGWYDEGSNVTVTAVADPNCTFYRWNGDVPDGQEKQATLVFSALEPRSVTAQFALTYYVTTNGSDSADGRTWETARATLQSALADTVTGDALLVSNGVYAVTNQIAITNGVWVRSVNGPEATVIRRTAGAVRQVLLRHPEAVFDGFTIMRTTRGAAYLDGAGTLSNCIISNNVSDNNLVNGTVWLEKGGLVQGCRIINNFLNSSGGAGASGGGVYLNDGGLVDSCIISNNAVGYGGGLSHGGGAYITGPGRLRNCLIAGNNHNVNAGGVYCSGGTIESCTIVDNYCSPVTAVGGLYNSNGTILNTIIAYNNNKNGLSNHVNAGTTWSYTYSCTTPAVAGAGNTSLDPRFSDRAAQDYTLLPGPCVDTGANQAWMDEALDVAGGARLVSGTVDMGALESVPGALRCSFEGTPLEGLASNRVVFTASVGGTNTTGIVYVWSFQNDAAIDVAGADRVIVTNLYWPGLYSVRLTVSNAVGEADTQVRERYIKVAPVVAFVTTNGPSIYPYDSWARAATNVADAVGAGIDGTLVRVSNGVYRISRQIELLRNIAVRSVNGAGATEIRRQSGSSRIFYLTRPEAVVDGFTLVNANLGAVYLDTAGVVSNCVIRDNIGGLNAVFQGGGVYLKGGLVKNCNIINNALNYSGGNGGSGGGVYLSAGGILDTCIISNNVATYGTGGEGGGVYLSGGSMKNCLIFDNRHIANAGGVYCSGGIVENCTIASNRCGKAAATSPGGLQCANGTIRNTIIHDNWSVSGLFNYLNSGTWSYNYCSTWPTNGLVGSGNQDRDPLFRNAAIGDCRLGRGSPCINTGLYQAWMDGALDLAGQPRILNRLVDIGAYENPLPGGTLMILR